jgi:hypothetical protein
MARINPFITNGYHSEAYFCDRVEETSKLTQLLLNGKKIRENFIRAIASLRTGITSSEFLNTLKMSASSVQSAIRGLLEKDLVTSELGV